MKVVRIIFQIGILYVFYYLGVAIVSMTHLPLPPSVVGLIILAFCLQRKWLKVELIRDGAGFLISFMTLFFIPSIIGIVEYPELFTIKGSILLTAVMVSTLLSIFITGKLSDKIGEKEKNWREKMREKEGEKMVEDNIHH